MKTIAQQLKIKKFPFEIKDSNGNHIYYEDSNGGWWTKREYDSDSNQIYYEDSTGYWSKRECDSNGKPIYYERSDGFWEKREYDSKGVRIYFENSCGTVIDNRPKTDVQKAIELLTKEGLLVDGKILKQ
jgi:hypothetical protein